MRISLHAIEMANWALLPEHEQIFRMRRYRDCQPPYTFNPFRAAYRDIINDCSGLFPDAKRAPWDVVEKQILGKSRNDKELQANLKLAHSLYEQFDKDMVFGVRHEVHPLTLSNGFQLCLWSDFIAVYPDREVIFYHDPRSSSGLSKQGRRVVFSAMHERFIALGGQFSAYKQEIWARGPKSTGQVRIYSDTGVGLIGYDALDAALCRTINLFLEIAAEQKVNRRKQG